MKKLLFLSCFVLLCLSTFSQSKKAQDIDAIKSMCGCYKISFNFAETFSPNKDYEFFDNYKSGALEYVFPVEESKNKIVLQHLLVIGDSMIIKHWRQDWLYEHTDLYQYHKSNEWVYTSLPTKSVKGQWTQKVYQVDDSPRYEGSATWVHYDERHYWENTTDAPLPRRDRTKRSDYNVMTRTNRQEITAYGWLHEQDNDKVLRTDDGDELIAEEKGWNTYTKTEASNCDVAKVWWNQNQQYWADVRFVWDELFTKKQNLGLNMKVDDKILFSRLFDLGDQWATNKNYDSEKTKAKIRKAIGIHLKTDQLVSSVK